MTGPSNSSSLAKRHGSRSRDEHRLDPLVVGRVGPEVRIPCQRLGLIVDPAAVGHAVQPLVQRQAAVLAPFDADAQVDDGSGRAQQLGIRLRYGLVDPLEVPVVADSGLELVDLMFAARSSRGSGRREGHALNASASAPATSAISGSRRAPGGPHPRQGSCAQAPGWLRCFGWRLLGPVAVLGLASSLRRLGRLGPFGRFARFGLFARLGLTGRLPGATGSLALSLLPRPRRPQSGDLALEQPRKPSPGAGALCAAQPRA